MNVEEKKQWIGKWNKNSNSRHIGSQESHEKMLNIADLQGNANLSHNEMLPHCQKDRKQQVLTRV